MPACIGLSYLSGSCLHTLWRFSNTLGQQGSYHLHWLVDFCSKTMQGVICCVLQRHESSHCHYSVVKPLTALHLVSSVCKPADERSHNGCRGKRLGSAHLTRAGTAQLLRGTCLAGAALSNPQAWAVTPAWGGPSMQPSWASGITPALAVCARLSLLLCWKLTWQMWKPHSSSRRRNACSSSSCRLQTATASMPALLGIPMCHSFPK